MTRLAGASLLFATLTLIGACGVGGDDGDDMMPPKGDPLPDLDNHEVCQSAFQITGTFAPGNTPRPTDPDTGAPLTGCWPVGTWTFTATVVSRDYGPGETPTCATKPTVLPGYSFVVSRTPIDPNDPQGDTAETLMSTTNISGGMLHHIKMSQNGQGCQGGFEFGSTDGKHYWNMKPTLGKEVGATAISGNGDYIEYEADGWPWPRA